MEPLPLTSPTAPRTTFPTPRAVVAGAAAGCCAALCLAGCARYGAYDGTADPPRANLAAPAAPSSGTAGGPHESAAADPGLVATADVPVGGGVILDGQQLVVTQPTAGVFAAFGTTCPHAGCSVSAVADGAISCPCHGSRFGITDGSVLRGPAKKGLTARPVVAIDGKVRQV